VTNRPPVPLGREHLAELANALNGVSHAFDTVDSWGEQVAHVLSKGGRLLAAGNGGSAAQAQHLTAELVGRFHGDRRALSAIALHAETSSLTAIANDYGVDEMFARQVEAHGRPGDALVLLSTSGNSANLLRAAERARNCGLVSLAITGAGPNALANNCDDALIVPSPHTTVVQEAHLVVVHLLCAAIDAALAARSQRTIRLDNEISLTSKVSA
jgi:D-sedoheptulose 7-phosphate isomerase